LDCGFKSEIVEGSYAIVSGRMGMDLSWPSD
jgi:hypothetical protein